MNRLDVRLDGRGMRDTGEPIEARIPSLTGVELLRPQDRFIIDAKAVLTGTALHHAIAQIAPDLESLSTGGAADLQLFRVFVVRKHDWKQHRWNPGTWQYQALACRAAILPLGNRHA
jgi:hypothetical protein